MHRRVRFCLILPVLELNLVVLLHPVDVPPDDALELRPFHFLPEAKEHH